MELTNLLNKFKSKEEAKHEYFFAVEIAEELIKTAIWTVVDGHTQVVKVGQSQTWDGQNQEKLVSAIDQSISAVSEGVSPEPSGVIFGLPESWMDQENLNPDKKSYLKAICQELEFKPLGFVVTNTAVIQYLKIEEGTPPSAILLQLSSTEVNLSLVKLGKLVGTQLVGRSGDLGPDVEEGLSRFEKIDTLPSRMILYDGQHDFEEDRQQLTSYDWEEKLPFIHFPKVEVLPSDVSIKAISLSGGSEVAKSLGFDIKSQAKPSSPEPETKSLSAADLGFTSADIAASVKPAAEKIQEPELELAVEPKKTPKIQLIKATFTAFLSKLNKILKSIKFKSAPKTITWIIGSLAGLFILVFLSYWYFPKAQITLYFEPKSIDTDLEITIDSKATSLDSVKAILPGESVDISVEASKSTPTTGKALVGESATGNITIYNVTNQTKSFLKNTVLIGPNNLTFSLDEDTTVASSSSRKEGEDIITSPGKADASITANNIGTDSNLSADTRLAFKQFSEDDYYAKTAGLSGGTSQEVRAVAQADIDQLLTEINPELITKAQTELQARLGNNKILVEIEDQEKLISRKFNHSVNEQADTLVIEAKLEYTALSYNQTDLQLLLNEAIKEKIPDNFQVSDSSQANLEPAKLNKDNTATIQASYKANLLPKLDFEAIKDQLKGHYPQTIQDYLTSLPSFLRADIIIKPNLPKSLKTLPHVTKNILLEVKSE
ncbi:MAG: hypothetical protein V1810_01405 [Candidatus Beckwithbacteria bacterium]